MKFTHTTT